MQPVPPNKPAGKISAATFNKLLGSIDEIRTAQQRTGAPQAQGARDNSLVFCRNTSTSDISQYDAVQLAGPCVAPSADTREFFTRVMLDVTPPGDDNRALGVAVEPIPAGSCGRIRVAGVSQARVKRDSGNTDTTAGIAAGYSYLKAGGTGAEILWEDTANPLGDGSCLALVRIGAGGGASTAIPAALTVFKFVNFYDVEGQAEYLVGKKRLPDGTFETSTTNVLRAGVFRPSTYSEQSNGFLFYRYGGAQSRSVSSGTSYGNYIHQESVFPPLEANDLFFAVQDEQSGDWLEIVTGEREWVREMIEPPSALWQLDQVEAAISYRGTITNVLGNTLEVSHNGGTVIVDKPLDLQRDTWVNYGIQNGVTWACPAPFNTLTGTMRDAENNVVGTCILDLSPPYQVGELINFLDVATPYDMNTIKRHWKVRLNYLQCGNNAAQLQGRTWADIVDSFAPLSHSHPEYQPAGNYIPLEQKAAASGVASLNASTQVVQDPASAATTKTNNAIVKADANGNLTDWVSAIKAASAAGKYLRDDGTWASTGLEVAAFKITGVNENDNIVCKKVKPDGTLETSDTSVSKPSSLSTSATSLGNGYYADYPEWYTRRVAKGDPVADHEYSVETMAPMYEVDQFIVAAYTGGAWIDLNIQSRDWVREPGGGLTELRAGGPGTGTTRLCTNPTQIIDDEGNEAALADIIRVKPPVVQGQSFKPGINIIDGFIMGVEGSVIKWVPLTCFQIVNGKLALDISQIQLYDSITKEAVALSDIFKVIGSNICIKTTAYFNDGTNKHQLDIVRDTTQTPNKFIAGTGLYRT